MEPDLSQHNTLYDEAVGLADAARGWFDGPGRSLIAALPPAQRVKGMTESLAIAARLMAAISHMLHPDPSANRFNPPHEPPMAEDHPLSGTTGGQIALASRHLVERLSQQHIREHP